MKPSRPLPAPLACAILGVCLGVPVASAQVPAARAPVSPPQAAQAPGQFPAQAPGQSPAQAPAASRFSAQAAPQAPAPVAAVPARAIAPQAQPAAAPGPQAAAAPAPQAVNIAMEDQHRTPHDTASLRGDVVVLLYADRNGAEAAHEIGKRLHVHFHPGAARVEGPDWLRQPVIGINGWPAGARVPNVHAVAIACLPEIPRAVHPVVRTRIRQESPHVPVWLDFAGTMPRSFGMLPDVPNILVIDTFGRPQGVLSGEIDEAKFQQLVAAVERLRQQAQPVRTASAVEAAPPTR